MNKREVYLVDGARTPFLRAKGKPNEFPAADLLLGAARPLMLRQPFAADAFDEVVMGCVMPGPDESNIARILALRLGCGEQMSAFTVQRNCASGMQALDVACRNIADGYQEMVLAGGVEAMSHAPLLFRQPMVEWLADWNRTRTFSARLKQLLKLRAGYFAPVIAILKGLSDPVVGLSMGQTAENLAWRFGIDRRTMDAYALQSHQRLNAAVENGHLEEIVPLYGVSGRVHDHDDGLRADSTLEKLAKLKPAFDRPYGLVTAGNSAQITDGATCLILASKKAVEKHDLPVMARLHPAWWAGVDPAQMGLGPVHAIAKLLQNQSLTLSDMDYWEINEAFAAQVLACRKALADPDYCREYLGTEKPFGKIPLQRLNVDGGGISLGHPVGSSGARIVLHLAHVLRREKKRRGIASLCIGGGQGGAMLVENLSEQNHESL
jgi:acetyl-CoA C-acetyltransferase